MGQEEHTVGAGGKQWGKASGDVEMMGLRRATPRWADEIVWILEILGNI